jgi:hypothetical protein
VTQSSWIGCPDGCAMVTKLMQVGVTPWCMMKTTFRKTLSLGKAWRMTMGLRTGKAFLLSDLISIKRLDTACCHVEFKHHRCSKTLINITLAYSSNPSWTSQDNGFSSSPSSLRGQQRAPSHGHWLRPDGLERWLRQCAVSLNLPPAYASNSYLMRVLILTLTNQ